MESNSKEEELIKMERRELCAIHKLRLDDIDKKLSVIYVALYGNGRPEHGLLWISTKNKEALEWIGKTVFGILIVVVANITLRLLPEVARVLSTGKL